MSDQIPIGSPPAPPGRHAAPPGWYADPIDRRQERYWDGWQWSRTTRVVEHGAGRAPGPAATASPYGWQQPAGSSGPTNGRYGGQVGGPYPGRQHDDGLTIGSRGASLTTADGVPVASWGMRALAAIVDLLLVGIVTIAASTPFYLKMLSLFWQSMVVAGEAARRGAPAPQAPTMADLMNTMTSTDQLLAGLVAALIGTAYFALLWRFRSATLGQLLCGLRVVPVDRGRDRSKLSWSAAIIRALIWVLPRLSAYLLLFWVLNCLFPLWNPKRQALHDLAARTQVVRVR